MMVQKDMKRAEEAASLSALLMQTFDLARRHTTQPGAEQMALALFVAPLIRGQHDVFMQWINEADRAWGSTEKKQ